MVKPRFLAFLAVVASLGFGYWLIEEPHSSRELFLCGTAWILGFWVATGIRSSRAALDLEDDDSWEYDEDEDA